jgi:hypothetical protein
MDAAEAARDAGAAWLKDAKTRLSGPGIMPGPVSKAIGAGDAFPAADGFADWRALLPAMPPRFRTTTTGRGWFCPGLRAIPEPSALTSRLARGFAGAYFTSRFYIA